MTEPAISVVVPTYNPGAELRALLAALAGQSLPAREILLVDSSADSSHTQQVARVFGARFESVTAEGFGHGRTRNDAAAMCSGKMIAFFTQDAVPAEDNVLERMAEALTLENVAGVYARQIPREDASARTRAEVLGWFEDGVRPFVQGGLEPGEWEELSPLERYRRARFDNVASMVRADVLRDYPFPETYFGEDIGWGLQMIENGFSLAYVPHARVIHSHDRDAGYEFRRTVNCHARLHELFGLETVPSLAGAVSGFVRESVGSYRAHGAFMAAREAARAFGQYFGARLSRTGLAGRFHFRGI